MKQRRVGTFTLGITLILIGILIPVMLIFKDNAIWILQTAPIVLIFLGIEVLIYAFKFKEDKLKYDGVSIFLIILITLLSVGIATISPLVDDAIKGHRVYQKAVSETETLLDDLLDDNKLNAVADVYDMNNDMEWYTNVKPDDIEFGSTIYYHWDPKEQEPTKEQIADKFMNFAKSVNIELNRMDIQIIYKDSDYASINLRKHDFKNMTKERLMDNITMSKNNVEINKNE